MRKSGCSRSVCVNPLQLQPYLSLLQVLAPLGGKGGGRPAKAQGSAADTSKLGDVLDLAAKFAQSKLQ
jgi:alanyl-tRNA synthetase